MDAVKRLAGRHSGNGGVGTSPAEFRKLYDAALLSVQTDLGSPGYAPIPSNDTDRADTHREKYVRARWAPAPTP